jgi:hypothetical protein
VKKNRLPFVAVTALIKVGEADLGSLLESLQFSGLAGLHQPQALARNFTGILVAAGAHQFGYNFLMVVGQYDVAGRQDLRPWSDGRIIVDLAY